MLSIPPDLRTRYVTFLKRKAITINEQGYLIKWLRYYLDFCHKYHFLQTERASISHFLRKLQDKKQTKARQEQATRAITLYLDLVSSGKELKNAVNPAPAILSTSTTSSISKTSNNILLSFPASANKTQKKTSNKGDFYFQKQDSSFNDSYLIAEAALSPSPKHHITNEDRSVRSQHLTKIKIQ